MDVLQAGLVIIAFASVRLLIPTMALLALGTWINRYNAQWDLH